MAVKPQAKPEPVKSKDEAQDGPLMDGHAGFKKMLAKGKAAEQVKSLAASGQCGPARSVAAAAVPLGAKLDKVVDAAPACKGK